VRVPLGVGTLQSVSMRICHQAGVPVAEVLLVRGQGGTWVGSIDGRLVKGPRIGLWIRVRQNGAYRGVLGSVDDPIWIEVGEQILDVTPAQRKGGAGLISLQRSNTRPTFGYVDYTPALELTRAIDRMGERFSRVRHDGRRVLIQSGRNSDRADALRLDLLDIVDPFDGSLVDFVYLEPGYDSSRTPFSVDLTRRPDSGLSMRLAAGLPGRVMAHTSYRNGGHRLTFDGVLDLYPSGFEVSEDHSTGLPSEATNRLIDDRGRGAMLAYQADLADRFAVSVGLLQRSEAGYFGVWDTLAQGEWRQRNAVLLGLQRRPDPAADTQVNLNANIGLWQHDDQRQLAGAGLVLRDADGDGQAERFSEGVKFNLTQRLWNARAALELLHRIEDFRAGLRLSGDGAGLASGGVDVNRGDSGISLGRLLSHPSLGERAVFSDGFGSAELVAQYQKGAWEMRGQLGGVLAAVLDRAWTGTLRAGHKIPGRQTRLTLWSKPQRRLLDRHLAPEGYLAQGLSDSMPFGAVVLDSQSRLTAPFSEGVRFDGLWKTSRSAGLWLYNLNFGIEELAHSSDGVDRSGNTAPFANDGSVRSWWLAGCMDFAAFSGLRFQGMLWLGQSFAQQIGGRGSEPPEIDQPWVGLSESPVWRWRNSITQVVGARWMTGGTLEAFSPMSNSDRSALTTLHTFTIPAQLRVDAWVRYQRKQLGLTLRADNAMSPNLLQPVPRPDRVPGLLPVGPRRIMLSVEWRPLGRSGRADAFE
jgi:hypothetical protein